VVAATLCVVAAFVLVRGYVFASTHGSLSVYVVDASSAAARQATAPLELTFLDSSGAVLARTAADQPTNVIYPTFPVAYACHGVELRAAFSAEARREWDRCFERQSRWIPTWASRASSVNLRSAACSISRAPVSVSASRDKWWLWWVPLPHVGGNPFTYFSIDLRFDPSRCTLTSERSGTH
jgi:hypothetical protein